MGGKSLGGKTLPKKRKQVSSSEESSEDSDNGGGKARAPTSCPPPHNAGAAMHGGSSWSQPHPRGSAARGSEDGAGGVVLIALPKPRSLSGFKRTPCTGHCISVQRQQTSSALHQKRVPLNGHASCSPVAAASYDLARGHLKSPAVNYIETSAKLDFPWRAHLRSVQAIYPPPTKSLRPYRSKYRTVVKPIFQPQKVYFWWLVAGKRSAGQQLE